LYREREGKLAWVGRDRRRQRTHKGIDIFQAQIQYLIRNTWEGRLKRRWEKEGASLYGNISIKM